MVAVQSVDYAVTHVGKNIEVHRLHGHPYGEKVSGKGMNTKAHDIGTPEACSGASLRKLSPR
jgi:hypothetical protein